MTRHFDGLQQLGRALMLPIAVLPIAGLLLRMGQPDLLDWAAMASAGDAVFANLGLLFAVGVGIGLARENHGAAGLAALVGFLVTTHAVATMLHAPPGSLDKLSIPLGLISGLIAGAAYNRWSNISLPSYLSFFGGRRFVPIVSGVAGLLLAAVVGIAWPYLERGMDAISQAILHAGSLGLFAYGLLNRVLIVTGLHHILNNFAWFIIGDYHGATGDLKRFFAGDPAAGAFMSGFFPVMMFGLPGACLAMYRAARPERRAAVGGMLLSLGLTSFLTGVTEPVEFTFMFLAPVLYALHALATGLAMVIMNLLGVKLGFSFSAGLFDYILNFGHAQRPLLLIPVGAAYFALYYGVFYACITKFDLATPGRALTGAPPPAAVTNAERAVAFIDALGGGANLLEVAACTTRLRMVLADNADIDEAALQRLGARGVIRASSQGLQVVLGPIADQVAGEIRAALRSAAGAVPAGAVPASAVPAGAVPAGAPPQSLDKLLAALGGRANVRRCEEFAGRLLLEVENVGIIDAAALGQAGVRGVAQTGGHTVQLITPAAAIWREPLRRVLAGA